MNSDITLRLNVASVPHTVVELDSVNDCIVEAGVK
jgi:hypothetical protein